ncbi:hypothetical protein, partial [Salmonella enterica]|uniref:hypothetical protein n=1 Tax=Salmonella enterica TaxID=28901 RepID=UPI001ED9C2C0
ILRQSTFSKKARLYKLPPICGFNKRKLLFFARAGKFAMLHIPLKTLITGAITFRTILLRR